MRSFISPYMLMGIFVALSLPAVAQHTRQQIVNTKKTNDMQQVVIDRIIAPAKAKNVFTERMNANRSILKQQPGFIGDEVYEQDDEQGNLVVITIARWQNEGVLMKAKEQVQAEYKRTGFDVNEFCLQQGIQMQRGIFRPAVY